MELDRPDRPSKRRRSAAVSAPSSSWSRSWWVCSARPSSPGSFTSAQSARGDELSDAKARQAQIKKDIAAQKAQVAKLTALQGDLAARRSSKTAERAQGHQRRPRRGQGQDHDDGRPRSTSSRPTTTLSSTSSGRSTPSWPSSRPRRSPRRPTSPSARQLLAERLRSAYDTDRTSLLETFLSGGTFTDLLAEMSYYIDVGEQDKALASEIAQDQETLAALHQTTEDTRAQTERPAPGRRPPRSAPSTRACASSTRARPRSSSSRSGRPPRSPRRSATYAADRPQQGRRQAALAKAAAAQKKLQGPDRRAHPQADAGRQHPVGVQRDADLADERRRDPELRLHRVLVGAAARLVRPLPPGHRHRRRRTARRSRPRATGPSSTSAGTTPTAPDPAWIVIIAHSEGSRPGTPTCSRAIRAGSTPGSRGQRRPGHRLRGQHRPLDRRAPPLGGHVQRRLRQPAPVPVAAGRRPRAGR